MRGSRPRRTWAPIAALLALLLGVAGAQATLVVNGVEVDGVTSSLVPGTAYAPAAAFAGALGARFDVDPTARLVTYAFGARLLQIRVVDDPDRATLVSPALTVDGAARPGPAAVYVGVEPFVPVKATGEALGAAVSFLADRNVVAVVVPPATVVGGVEGRAGQERLVLRASAPTRVTSYFAESTQTLQLRFERAEAAQASAFEGDGFVRADVLPSRGGVDVRVQLAPETSYTLREVPDGAGFALVVAFGAARADPAPSEQERPDTARVVLDTLPPRPGEADLTAGLAATLEASLRRAGYEVQHTRSGDATPPLHERSAAGVGSRLYLSIQTADLPRGRLRVHYLGEATDLPALEDAIRFNAETSLRRPETDGVRRQILLELVVDLDVGRRYAEALALEVQQYGGYQVDGPHRAPLAVLTGAGGRGLLLEVGVDDLRDPSFAPMLAATLATVLGSGGLVP